MSQLLAGQDRADPRRGQSLESGLCHRAGLFAEGAKLILTYQGDRQKLTVEELAADLKAVKTLACDVTQDEELAAT